MTTIIHSTLNPTILEIPEPPAEFGQDGGKFYRCYDTLAGEIDEDMTEGLKEHLDGLLIFVGIFTKAHPWMTPNNHFGFFIDIIIGWPLRERQFGLPCINPPNDESQSCG